MMKYIQPFFYIALFTISVSFLEVMGEECELTKGIKKIKDTLCPHSSSGIPPELKNLPYAIYPRSPYYNIVRFNYNERFNYHPKAIIYPTNFQEAQYVLGVLKSYHLDFAVRSGKHCSEPGSLSPDYIFDVSNFNSIIPDVANSQVYIGAGCILQNVITTLGNLGYAIPTGTCPTVGVAGLTLGGGIGYLLPLYGLTCDSVLSITLLTADLGIIEVSAINYPDLFWALLGAGNGSYGIVLGFNFQMYNIPTVTFYELLWEYDPDLIPPIMTAWQSWVKSLPDNISTVLGIRHPNHLAAEPDNAPPLLIRIVGLKVGSDPFNEWQDPFGPLNPTVKLFQGSYLDVSKYWVTETNLPYNKWKSKILMEPVSECVIKKVTRFFKKLECRNPDYLVYFNFEAFGGNLSHHDTAFFPRNAFGWWQQAYYWDKKKQTKKVLKLSREFYCKIPKSVSKYCYANIVDYDLGNTYLNKYYGNHVKRLIQIKNKYDPENLFRWRQSIPLSRECRH